jgi:hypothetical protein
VAQLVQYEVVMIFAAMEMKQMKQKPTSLLLGLFLALAVCFPLLAEVPGSFKDISGHYEAIRQALLHDTADGIAGHAESIREIASATAPEDSSSEAADLIQLILNSAVKLKSSGNLAEAREAFGELSKPMVRLREMVSEPESVVVYCSMAKKAWLQPEGEVGNPYYGQSMARCGKIVSE